jgi:phytoene synthase
MTVPSTAEPGITRAAASGAAECRSVTRRYARTFYFASHCLPAATRRHAYAIYAFCRSADNAVDEAATPAEALERVERSRVELDDAYGAGAVPPGLAELRRTVRGRSIPRGLFEALLDGMAMDLTVSRYATYGELDVYCYRVAGVVGEMMAHVFGFRDARCLPRAVALGRAMQLTNILRDVGEDLGRGRVYLPQDELARFGVDEAQLAAGRVDDRFRELMRFQVARARASYAEADAGIPDLVGAASRLTVRVMSRLYGGILGAIERLDYDVFRARARVSGPRKLAGLARCLADEARSARPR